MTSDVPQLPASGTVRNFFLKRLRMREGTLLLVTAIVIGLAAGLAALVFESCYHGLNALLIRPIVKEGFFPYLIVIVPAVGGLLTGLLLKLAGKNANGHGVPEVIESVNLRVGQIRFKNALLRTAAAILTLGFGGSAGPEGPMVHIGSAFGSVSGRAVGSSEEHTKVMIACGAAAGLAAIFHAPIAGVIFVLEVILIDFSLDTFIPIIVASITASVVARATWGEGALLVSSPKLALTLGHVPLFAILGLLGAVLSVSFIKVFVVVDDFWKRVRIPSYVKPALGGLLVGLAALKFPHILSDGYDTINAALGTSLPITLVLMLIFVKLIATSMTLGSGGSGGMFAPTLFLGAMMGSVFGVWMNAHFPAIGITPGAFALVGMGAAMAGTLFAPVTAVIMIFEITNNYSFILPLMIASITSVVLARRLTEDSIYTIGLSQKGIRLHGGRDENLLRSTCVSSIMRRDFPAVHVDWPLMKVLDQLTKSPHSTLPVVDEHDKFVGIVPFDTLRQLINEESLSWLLIAKDFLKHDVVTLKPDDDLREALEKFVTQNVDELPVIDHGDSQTILGILSRGDLLTAYNHKLLQREAGQAIFRSEPIQVPSYVRRGVRRAADATSRFLAWFALARKELGENEPRANSYELAAAARAQKSPGRNN